MIPGPGGRRRLGALLGPLLGALCAVLLLAGQARAEQRVALVIGNGAYATLPQLPNPPADAAAVADRLRSLGFDVAQGTDLDKAAMDRAVRAFGRKAAQADVAMVFYAGHGVQVGGRNYLVPVDAGLPAREQDLRYDFVDVAGIMDELADTKHLRIVVLDACRDNPIPARLQRGLGRGIGAERGLAAPPGLDNTLIAYATAADATAADGNGRNSPFTAALLKHLGDPGLDVRLMFGRVRDEVRRTTNNRQNPFVYESLGGDAFYFQPAADQVPVPPPPPAQSSALPSAPQPVQPPPVAQQRTPVAKLPAPDTAPNPAPYAPPDVRSDAVPAADWAAALAGRWRLSNGRSCTGGYGTATVRDGTIRFEWRLPGGRLNVAVERIDQVQGNVVVTTVLSDVGTPTPETGNRVRYEFRADRWSSENLDTRERGTHLRC